ncbi:iron ABC transporter substrate-binding protein [Cohnella sp. CIP 111063]|jgi:ABC-type Fe3+ transport system, periplasmic component|uniref:ABC transporter substrate-binding protein n=1 Tax=unclassified Cohnella TaxID=2636738 RepID=UPI000B8BF7AC|nr:MULTISPECIES: ABC transporter substrate-binding protein [unclassified Cohnella]OXS56584.1 iron ABC transporter substrate-binding protein [Cohnella sp. CIP 111063]PRX68767.1 iron(III) transport system substrate-binding protein [Cohnella sp. SGD-V74]
MRKKWYAGAVATALSVGLLAGCGSNDSKPSASSEASKAPESASSASSEGAAKLSGKVTIYSPNQAEINNPILKEFQTRTGIEVELISGGTGELLKRVQAEENNPLGDVFFGGGAESLAAYGQYFEVYETTESANIGDAYKDSANHFTPFSALPMIIMYNKDLVKEGEEPKGWQDLLDPKWKGKIAFADPAKSGSSFTQIVTFLSAFGRDDGQGWEFVKSFLDNLDGKMLSGSSMVYKGVADKEFTLGVTLEEAALRNLEGGANVGIIYPVEGTSAVPDGLAVIKSAKNMENAKAFVDFAVSKDVQDMLQKEFKRRPVRTDANETQGIPASKDIKLVDYDFDWASQNKDEIIKKFTRIVTGQDK